MLPWPAAQGQFLGLGSILLLLIIYHRCGWSCAYAPQKWWCNVHILSNGIGMCVTFLWWSKNIGHKTFLELNCCWTPNVFFGYKFFWDPIFLPEILKKKKHIMDSTFFCPTFIFDSKFHFYKVRKKKEGSNFFSKFFQY